MNRKQKQRKRSHERIRRIVRTIPFQRALKELSPQEQRMVEHKVIFLSANPHHPSLQVHRLKGRPGMWVCYVSRSYRLLYRWHNTTLFLCDVGRHRMVDRVRRKWRERLVVPGGNYS